MEQETLTVRFDGQQHQVELQTFALSVLNFAGVLRESNRRVGGSAIEIHIKAPEKGSVLVDLIATANQVATLVPPVHTLADMVGIAGGLYALHDRISGNKISSTEKESGNTKIIFEDGSQFVVAENVYNLYSESPAIPNLISQNFSALSGDPAVEKFEVKNKGKAIIEIEQKDFSRLAIKQQVDDENSRSFTEAANLYIYKMVFDKTDRKWEFYYKGNRISANITDDEFYRAIDSGERFAKGDQLRVDLQINQIIDPSVGIYVNQSYIVLKVHEHIARSSSQELPFNKKFET